MGESVIDDHLINFNPGTRRYDCLSPRGAADSEDHGYDPGKAQWRQHQKPLSLWHSSRIEERPEVSCECQLSPLMHPPLALELQSQRSRRANLRRRSGSPDRGTQHAALSWFARTQRTETEATGRAGGGDCSFPAARVVVTVCRFRRSRSGGPRPSPVDSEESSSWLSSDQLARLVKAEPRRAWIEFARVAITKVAKEIGFDRRPGEERLVHLGVIEARHRATVEPQRPSGQHEVGALERRVPQRSILQ